MLHFDLFYCYFHADCSSELTNCTSLPIPGLRCTKLSTSSHPCSVHLFNARVNQYFDSFIPYTGKLWNSSFVCFPTYLWLELFQKRSVKTPLMLKWTSIPCFYFSYCPLYRIWRQAGSFLNVFLLSLGRYLFSVKKKIWFTASLGIKISRVL